MELETEQTVANVAVDCKRNDIVVEPNEMETDWLLFSSEYTQNMCSKCLIALKYDCCNAIIHHWLHYTTTIISAQYCLCESRYVCIVHRLEPALMCKCMDITTKQKTYDTSSFWYNTLHRGGYFLYGKFDQYILFLISLYLFPFQFELQPLGAQLNLCGMINSIILSI